MKKIISFLVILCLMAVGVSALERYTGSPTLPYLVYGHVSWNDQLLSGARLEITNQNTGMVKQITTDPKGYWQEDATSWLSSAAGRMPVQYGDVIKIRVTDGCGTGDTCEKSFSAYSTEYSDWAEIDFSITGNLACPPINCPSTSCGGSSCSYSESKCESLYPSEEKTCPGTSCSEPITCPEEKVCPQVEDCPVCGDEGESPNPDDEDGFNYFLAVLFAVAGGGIGSYAMYKTKQGEAVTYKKGTGYKVYVGNDGTLKEVHKHPGTRGYHDIQNKHRPAIECHPPGTKTPLYEKNVDGEWEYVE